MSAIKHNCCTKSNAFLGYAEGEWRFNSNIIPGAYTVVTHCPFCGEKLPDGWPRDVTATITPPGEFKVELIGSSIGFNRSAYQVMFRADYEPMARAKIAFRFDGHLITTGTVVGWLDKNKTHLAVAADPYVVPNVPLCDAVRRP